MLYKLLTIYISILCVNAFYVKKRPNFWENTLFSERLPLWLEKRFYARDYLTNQVFDSDRDYKYDVSNDQDLNRYYNFRRPIINQYYAKPWTYDDIPNRLDLERYYESRKPKYKHYNIKPWNYNEIREPFEFVKQRSKLSDQSVISAGFMNNLKSHYNWIPAIIGSVCTVIIVLAVIGTATLYQKNKNNKERNKDIDKASSISSYNMRGDRKLAQSAQMYHYQHQKQQMLALEKAGDKAQASEEDSEDDDDDDDVNENDFTIYDCPKVINETEIAVDNPMFNGKLTNQDNNTNGNSSGELIQYSDTEDCEKQNTKL